MRSLFKPRPSPDPDPAAPHFADTYSAPPTPARAGPVAVPLTHRRRTLLAVLAGAMAVAAVGLSSPLWIRSPQQLAADARAPEPTVLTALVERRVLRDTLVVRGDVRPSQSFDVTPANGADGKGVITAVRVKQGDQVRAGIVVLEVSGRPLIVLRGAVPAYRDLKPGASGKDIAQLQVALTALGHPARDRRGYFGPATKRALTGFYDSLGYEPLPVSADDDKQVAAARRQVVEAQRLVDDARDAAEALRADPHADPRERSQAEKALVRAVEDLAAARVSLTELEQVTGPTLPLGEYVFLPSFPARVDTLKATVGGEPATPTISFSAGRLVIRASLTQSQRTRCEIGAVVEITGDGGLRAAGRVTTVGDLPGTGSGDGSQAGGKTGGGDADGGSGYPLTVTPDEALDPRFTGQNVRLSVRLAVSDGEQLVVPVSAIYAGADGQVYVTRRAADGGEQRVTVQPGMSAEGYVAVRVISGKLAPGDRVIIGAG